MVIFGNNVEYGGIRSVFSLNCVKRVRCTGVSIM